MTERSAASPSFLLEVASAYEAASRRRIPPPAFGPPPGRNAGR